MSQIEINNSINSVNVENTINTVDVNNDNGNIIVVPQDVVKIIEVNTPGPQGPKGSPGDVNELTASFVGTASFFEFTQSYHEDSSSFSASISQLQDFSSSLDTTFATDAELQQATASLSASIGLLSGSYLESSASFDTQISESNNNINTLSSSFVSFSGSYNTGSFTGSFIGNGSGLIGVISSSYAISASQAQNANSTISASYSSTSSYANNFTVAGTLTAQVINVQTITSSTEYVTGSTIFGSSLSDTHQFTGSVNITGSLSVNNSNVILTNQTASMTVATASYSNFAVTAAYASNVPETASYAISASQAQNANLLNGYDSNAFVLSSSYNQFTSSYLADSASFSASISQLQDFSSSLDNTFVTELELQQATASLSASIGLLSGSYLESSASFDTRISESNVDINLLSSSFVSFSGSYNTGSFTGSFSGDFNGNGSGIVGIVSASYALTASYASNVPVTASYAISASQAQNANNAVSASYASLANNALTASQASSSFRSDISNQVEGGSINHLALWVANTLLSSSYLTQNDSILNTLYNNVNKGISLNFGINEYSLGQYNNQGNGTKIKISDDTGEITLNSINRVFISSSLGVNRLPTSGSSLDVEGNTLITGSLYVSDDIVGNLQGSSSYAVTASYADDFLVKGTLTAQTLNVQTVSSSVIYSSGSNIFGNNLSNTQTFTGSVSITGSLTVNNSNAILTNQTSSMTVLSASQAQNAVSASYALSASHATNVNGAINYIPIYNSPNSISSSAIYQSGGYSIAINQTNVTEAAPEALYVWQPNINSFNVISGKGNSDNYLQLNIQNTNLGTSASSDIVATANNGTETSFYVDMGINNENYIDNGNGVGSANDAYVYSLANHFHIGNATPGQHLGFFVGGFNVYDNNKFQLSSNNLHEMTGSLDISGSLLVHDGITGSLYGTSSYAITSSHAINAISASYALNALSSSYSLSASYTLNADLLDGKNSTEFAITGSNTFTGNQIMSGAIQLNPTPDPGMGNISSSYLFVSSSNTEFGADLYFRQNTNEVKWKWIEGQLSTGLLYGGLVTFSGSQFTVSSGSGIIVNHNANYTSELSPIVTYVTWSNTTQNVTNISTEQLTWIYIDSNGNLIQQNIPFTVEQYHDSIPLGILSHINYTNILTFAGSVIPVYDSIYNTHTFIEAFGPLKLSGLNINPIEGTMKIGYESGTTYSYGGYYSQSAELPSTRTFNATPTGSLTYAYRSGSTFAYTPLTTQLTASLYDNGSGTLQNVGPSNYSIQRVFLGPVGRLILYFGQTIYSSLSSAVQSISTDPFIEGNVTKDIGVFLGYLVLRGNTTDVGDTVNNTVVQAGLFRSTVGGGGGGTVVTNLNDLGDVSIVGPSNGQGLIYESGLWINGTPSLATFATLSLSSSFASQSISSSFTQNAVSSSYALTASYALNVPVTASYAISSSQATNANTATTASYVLNAISSSYALSASQAQNSNVATSASYAATSSYADNFTIKNTYIFDGTLNDYILVTGTIVGINNIFSQPTGSFTSAFFKYTVYKGTSARTGEVMAVWNGSNVEYNDTSTNDIGGSTSDVTMYATLAGGNIEFNTNTLSSGWNIKALSTYM